MGVAFVLHGWPKIQNPMGWMNAMGMQSVPSFLQALAALAEFGGGIALGLIVGDSLVSFKPLPLIVTVGILIVIAVGAGLLLRTLKKRK